MTEFAYQLEMNRTFDDRYYVRTFEGGALLKEYQYDTKQDLDDALPVLTEFNRED